MSPWRPASNGNGKRHWFLFRDAEKIMDRYLWSKARPGQKWPGPLIRFASFQSAYRKAEQLNNVDQDAPMT